MFLFPDEQEPLYSLDEETRKEFLTKAQREDSLTVLDPQQVLATENPGYVYPEERHDSGSQVEEHRSRASLECRSLLESSRTQGRS